nr:MAG TPA: hypothetical protein [Caudoviricetes sp.]
MIEYHKENLKIFLGVDCINYYLVSCNIHICRSICICTLDDNKYCNTNRCSSNCCNCINGNCHLYNGIVHGLID